MFSSADRCIYGKNQILETVCQFRYPAILSIETDLPAKFQEAIREVFPRYECKKEQPAPKVQMVPGQLPKVEQGQIVSNHCFMTADGLWRINLTKDFIALTTRKYTAWEEFARMLDKPLGQFIQLYKPAYFDRVGLRYVNAFSKKELDVEHLPWRELIEDRYLGVMAEESVQETAFARCTQDLDMALPGSCRMKLHAGPGLVQKQGETVKDPRFLLDIDVSMGGNLPVNMAAGALSTLHVHAWSVFRGAITDNLHEAMEPGE